MIPIISLAFLSKQVISGTVCFAIPVTISSYLNHDPRSQSRSELQQMFSPQLEKKMKAPTLSYQVILAPNRTKPGTGGFY